MDKILINKILDKQSRTLVGILLKRIDILNQSNLLTPEIYKNLIKELVYENFRSLKEIFSLINQSVDRIVYQSKENKYGKK